MPRGTTLSPHPRRAAVPVQDDAPRHVATGNPAMAGGDAMLRRRDDPASARPAPEYRMT
jgi:hypothetical protein